MSLRESNAAELERLLEPDQTRTVKPQSSAVLFSATAPRQCIEQVELPEEHHSLFFDLARTLISDGITRPQTLAKILEEVRPDGSLRKYSEALWDILGIADKNLRGTHDWNAIYAELEKPKRKPVAKKPRQTKATKLPNTEPLSQQPPSALPDANQAKVKEALQKMPEIWSKVLEAKMRGDDIPDIAEANGISEVAVGNVLRVAKGRLRTLLAQQAATKNSPMQDEAESKPAAPPIIVAKPAVKKKRGFFAWLKGEEKWRTAWEEWNSKAFHDVVEEDHEKGSVIRTIVYEVASTSGRRAVVLGTRCSYHGRASRVIHEFTRKLQASQTGPYWISGSSSKWKATGRAHIVTVFQTKGDHRFTSSSVFQKDREPDIHRQLLAIVEEDTPLNASLDLSEFAYRANCWPSMVGNPKPD